MQFTDIFGVILLIVTITSAVTAPERRAQELSERRDKHIKRRDTTLILEEHHVRKPVKKTKVVYRKMPKQKFHRKPAHVPKKPIRRPPPKREHYKQSYTASLAARQNKRQAKPVFGRYMGYRLKTNHYSPENTAIHKYAPQPFNALAEFGEPPIEFEDHTQKISFGEPPQFKINDNVYKERPNIAFGTSFLPNMKNHRLTSHGYPSKPNDIDEDIKNEKEYLQWQSYLQNEADNAQHSYDKKHAAFTNPMDEGDFDTYPLKSYSDVYNYGQPQSQFPQDVKKKMFNVRNKLLNQPWVSNKVFRDNDLEVVGGQYAEPPARITSMFTGDEDYELKFRSDDLERPYPGHTSPYVNYKNSNMAFSPQNLNDAFSL